MSTTFPLATLVAQITPTGISAPSYADILSSLIASFQSIYGSDVLLTPDTQDHQLLALFALAIHDSNQTAIQIYNGFAPAFAQGLNLSALVKINGLQRLVPSNSSAVVTIVGQAGAVINNGIAQDVLGNLWDLPAQVIIPGGGSIAVTVTAEVQGALVAPANTITGVYTPTLGWQSVTNPAAAVPGNSVESDAQLRIRQQISTGLPAQTPLGAIAAVIANLPGVTRSIVYENSTGSTDANGIPGHSISAVVQGGNVTQIAQAIESKKSPGTGTYGSTTITVADTLGLTVNISFFALASTSIYVSLTIHALAGYVASTGTAIVDALVAFINSLPIGNIVYYDQIIAIATMLPSPLARTFTLTLLTTGTAPTPVGTTDITIAFNAAAVTQTANIVLTQT